MAKNTNKSQIPELDLFSVQVQYPNEIVNNQDVVEHFDDLDLSKNVLICNVKKDNVRHFLDGSAKIYYTGKKFPSTVALNKLFYFIPYFGKQCDLGFTGIRDLYLIKIARVGTRKEGTPENDPNDLRIVFELQFVKRLYDEYKPHHLNIWETFTDTTLNTLSVADKSKTNAIRFIDLFAGIGGIRLPFEELGYNCVFSSEWDEPAARTYEANFGEHPAGDITKINAADIPAHDLLLAGFPCQAFSIMGKMKGFEDVRGTMFFEIARILQYHKPATILLENVKQLTTHDQGKTFATILEILAQLGYHVKWKVLNALNFGLPQKRERVIIVGFLDEKKCEAFNFDFPKLDYYLETVLEPDDEVDKSLYASDQIIQKRQNKVDGKKVFYPSIWHENKAGNISVLDYACALRTGASYNYLLVNGVRRPSSRELLRLQGFPDTFKIVVPHSEIRRQTGNSVAVPMIRAVANKINQIINNNI